MIRVKLNDAIQVDVNTDDPAVATQEANAYFRQNHPREFSQWRNSQVGLLGTLGRSYVAGIDNAEANLYAVAEGLGQIVNLPSLQDFARQGRERAVQRAAEVLPESLRPPSFEEAQSIGDYARFTAGSLGAALPSTVAPIAGGVIGGAVGGVPGAVVGAALGAYPELAGSNIRRQQEVSGGQIPSPGLAFAAAVPQALAEGAVDALTLRMARLLGRPAEEVGRNVISRILRGAGVGAGGEGASEVIQQGIERAQAGLDLFSPDALREYKEAAAGAAVAGGVMGGAARGVFGARPATAVTPEVQAPAEAAPQEAPTTFAQPAPAPAAPEAAVPTAPEAAPAAPAVEAQAAPEATPAPAPAPVQEAVQVQPEAAVPAAEQAAPITSFTTAKGSTYEAFSDGTTTRNKAARPEHPGDEGVKPRSTLTVYVDENAVNQLVPPADTNWRYIVTGDNAISLATQGPDGQWGIAPSQRDVPFTTEPSVGLHPMEFWRPETIADRQAFREVHPGNKIVEVTTAPAPEAEAAPAPEAAPEIPSEKLPNTDALWRGYSLNAGPEAKSPVVQTARDFSAQRGRPFTKPEFTQFAEQLNAAKTPEAIQKVLRDFAAPRQAAPTQGMAAQTPEAETQSLESFLNDGPTNMPIQNSQRILDEQIEDTFFNKVLRFFASPVMSLSQNPRYKPVANIMQALDTLQKRYNYMYMNSQMPSYGLSPESQEKIMLALQEARSKQQMPNRANFTPEEYAAIESQLKGFQRVLDNFIETFAHRYFDPAYATTPDARARLEAFQQSRNGRSLAQMPKEELQAASKQGYEAIQYYENLRDPYFFPQISQGSHFLAAYERLPNGTQDLVRIYFYDPSNAIQKKRGIANPEVEIKNLLRQEFPDTNRYYVMPKGVLATRDAQAKQLKTDGELIARYLEELKEVSTFKGKQIIERMSREINKAQMDRFFRPNNDKLRAVRPGRGAEYLMDVLPKYFAAASKIQAHLHHRKDFDREVGKLNESEQRYWNRLIDYVTTPSEAFGTARALVFFKYLGGAVDTAMIQLSQLPIVTAARLVRDAGNVRATAALSSASGTILRNLDVPKLFSGELTYTNHLISKGIFSRNEVEALMKARDEGWFDPVQTIESRGQVSTDTLRKAGLSDSEAGKMARGVNTVANLLGRPLSGTEEFNRITAFLAAYRLAAKHPDTIARANKVDNSSHANAYDYATGVLKDTNFLTSKVDRPEWMRFTPSAELFSQFVSPVWKLLEQYVLHGAKVVKGLKTSDPVLAKAGAVGLLYMMTAQIIFAGVWSLPFADRLRELAERLVKEIWGTPVDFKNELEDMLGGGLFAQIANNGIFHVAGVASTAKRLEIDPLPKGDLFSWSTLALLGPTGGFIESFPQAAQYYSNGDYWGFLANFPLMPRFAGNMIKGAQLAIDEEQRTRRGNVSIIPEQVRSFDQRNLVPASIRQAIGFPPPEFFDIRELVQRREEINDYTRDATQRINNELSRLLLQAYRASEDGNREAFIRYQNEYYRRRNEIIEEQQSRPPENRAEVNESVIRQRAERELLGPAAPEVMLERARRQARTPIQEEILRHQRRNE